MNKIIIASLQANSIKRNLHNLTPEQAETILGGIYPPGVGIMNVTDSTYLYYSPRQDQRYWAIGLSAHTSSENKYNTLDYSRSTYNGFI
ncbi:hypothetical protein [Anabaena sp. CCY 9614]|uniref:hypothetical protein n=1 Tax=Anabaena sp. CCY 9614 TaxID=3103869 RepID=UPI0039C758C6